MPETYSVRITKDDLVFSAAHFITFRGDVCERLHGHNYRVCVEVSGGLDENQYVIDFIEFRDQLRQIVSMLDHRMLLPTEHPDISVVETDGGDFGPSIQATFASRRWVFPKEDCLLLPIANTTTELLARYIGRQLVEWSSITSIPRLTGITVGVDENEGQWGRWHWTL